MISRNKIKFIVSLQKKKVREEERLYIIEGDKIVREFLSAGVVARTLIAKPEFIASLPTDLRNKAEEILEVSYDDLKKISTLKTPHNAIALIPLKDQIPDFSGILKELCVVLDNVQDPGNLGTIIRAAGWFGIKNIICSEGSVDIYNPKVIQATMGAILSVNVFYADLKDFLIIAGKNNTPVYGTLLEGKSIYSHKLDNKGIIMFGNESKGISEELLTYVSEKIMIPRCGTIKNGIDSLNVGMAASIVFSEFARRKSL